MNDAALSALYRLPQRRTEVDENTPFAHGATIDSGPAQNTKLGGESRPPFVATEAAAVAPASEQRKDWRSLGVLHVSG